MSDFSKSSTSLRKLMETIIFQQVAGGQTWAREGIIWFTLGGHKHHDKSMVLLLIILQRVLNALNLNLTTQPNTAFYFAYYLPANSNTSMKNTQFIHNSNFNIKRKTSLICCPCCYLQSVSIWLCCDWLQHTCCQINK